MSEARALAAREAVVGTVIALVMAGVFLALGSGRSLLVTFIPGLAFVRAALM